MEQEFIDILVIHGSDGDPYKSWIPWIHDLSIRNNKNCIVPHFPPFKLQTLENWSCVLDAYKHLITENTTVIAHSLGPAFFISWLNVNNININQFIAVTPFYDKSGNTDVDSLTVPFFVENISFDSIKIKIKKTTCIYSDNDPYVPKRLSESFADNLCAKKILISGGKHLNDEAGYSKLNEVALILKLSTS